MGPCLRLCAALALLAVPASATASGSDEILVKFRDTAEAADAARGAGTIAGRSARVASVLQRFRAQPQGRPFARARYRGLDQVVRYRVEGGAAGVDRALAELKRMPGVLYAEPNVRVHVAAAPNDPYYSSSGSWG